MRVSGRLPDSQKKASEKSGAIHRGHKGASGEA